MGLQNTFAGECCFIESYFELDRENDGYLCCFKQKNNYCHGKHFHSNIEILYVVDGEIDVTINDEQQKLTAGCASIAGSYDSHYYNSPKDSTVIILIIPIDSVSRFNGLIRNMSFPTNFLTQNSRTEQLYDAMSRLIEFHGTRDLLIAMGYIYVVLGIFIENLGLVKRETKMASNYLIRDILFYMEEHFLEDISIGSLSKKFGYNKSYISHLISKNLGYGFANYINLLKSRHAAIMIRNSFENVSMTEVASHSGFSNVRAFNRAFRDFYNVTPSEYRKRFIDSDKQNQ